MLKVGETIRKKECPDLYNLHKDKQGTPTMGGVLILLGVFVSTILWADIRNSFVLLALMVTGWLGGIGFLDDYKKLRSANLSAGYLKDDGNFKYSVEDSSVTRSNNDFERKFVALRATGRLSEKSNLRMMLIESQQERGVAGSIDWASPEARRDDNLQLSALTYNQLHTNGYSKVQLSYRRSLENYNDPNPWWPIKSEHDVRGTALKIQHHRNIWNDITGTFLYEGKLEKLESTDVGDRQRKTNSIASIITIPIWDNFNIIPALRLDRAGSNRLQPTVDLRLTYLNLRGIEIEYHYGTGFRYPTFNDLYWQPGGNPDLEPEKSRYQIMKYKLFLDRSEERRVGKECRSRWSPYH